MITSLILFGCFEDAFVLNLTLELPAQSKVGCGAVGLYRLWKTRSLDHVNISHAVQVVQITIDLQSKR